MTKSVTYKCPECKYRRKNGMDFWSHLQNKHNYSIERADDIHGIQTEIIEVEI